MGTCVHVFQWNGSGTCFDNARVGLSFAKQVPSVSRFERKSVGGGGGGGGGRERRRSRCKTRLTVETRLTIETRLTFETRLS